MIFTVIEGLLDSVEPDKIARTQKAILTTLRTDKKNILERIREKKELDEKLAEELSQCIKDVVGNKQT